MAYVTGTKLEDKSERSPKPFAFSLRIRKASSQYLKSLSVFSLLSISRLPPPLISKLSVFRLLLVSHSLSLIQSQPPLHSRSLHSRSLHSRSRSLLLSLRLLSAFFVWAKGSFFYFVFVWKACKGCSFKWLLMQKDVFFLFVEWFACKVLVFMWFLMEKEVFFGRFPILFWIWKGFWV